jgi:transposase InsO family protein
VFVDLLESKVLVEDFCHHGYQRRPHGSLVYLTPARFAAVVGLDDGEQNAGKSEELESVPTLS